MKIYTPEEVKEKCIKELEKLIKSIKEDKNYYDYKLAFNITSIEEAYGVCRVFEEETVLTRTEIIKTKPTD